MLGCVPGGMEALRPVKSWRTEARVRIRPSGIAALGVTKTRGNSGTLLNAATTAKTHMAEIHAMELESTWLLRYSRSVDTSI